MFWAKYANKMRLRSIFDENQMKTTVLQSIAPICRRLDYYILKLSLPNINDFFRQSSFFSNEICQIYQHIFVHYQYPSTDMLILKDTSFKTKKWNKFKLIEFMIFGWNNETRDSISNITNHKSICRITLWKTKIYAQKWKFPTNLTINKWLIKQKGSVFVVPCRLFFVHRLTLSLSFRFVLTARL